MIDCMRGSVCVFVIVCVCVGGVCSVSVLVCVCVEKSYSKINWAITSILKETERDVCYTKQLRKKNISQIYQVLNDVAKAK